MIQDYSRGGPSILDARKTRRNHGASVSGLRERCFLPWAISIPTLSAAVGIRQKHVIDLSERVAQASTLSRLRFVFLSFGRHEGPRTLTNRSALASKWLR